MILKQLLLQIFNASKSSRIEIKDKYLGNVFHLCNINSVLEDYYQTKIKSTLKWLQKYECKSFLSYERKLFNKE